MPSQSVWFIWSYCSIFGRMQIVGKWDNFWTRFLWCFLKADKQKRPATCVAGLLVEISGIEPLTSWMPFKRSPKRYVHTPPWLVLGRCNKYDNTNKKLQIAFNLTNWKRIAEVCISIIRQKWRFNSCERFHLEDQNILLLCTFLFLNDTWFGGYYRSPKRPELFGTLFTGRGRPCSRMPSFSPLGGG